MHNLHVGMDIIFFNFILCFSMIYCRKKFSIVGWVPCAKAILSMSRFILSKVPNSSSVVTRHTLHVRWKIREICTVQAYKSASGLVEHDTLLVHWLHDGVKIAAIGRAGVAGRAEADASRAGVAGRAGIAGVAILRHFHSQSQSTLFFLSNQCLAKI